MRLFYKSAVRHFECIVSVNWTMDITYSKYYSELNGEAKTRYENKIRLILYEKDPFCHLEVDNLSLRGLQWYEWPDVTYSNIYNYLINTLSFCTHEQLKAYKSMDGYNFTLAVGLVI